MLPSRTPRYATLRLGAVLIAACSEGLPPERRGDGGASAEDISPGNAAKRCADACAYRSKTLGCGGDPSVCTAVCVAIHTVAGQAGSCSTLALELEGCHYSRMALEQGCVITDSQLDESICAMESAALEACEKQRDCRAGATCS